MPRTTVADGTSLRPDPDAATAVAGHASPLNNVIPRLAQLRPTGALGTKDEIQAELDSIAASVRSFHVKPPDMVMKECAAYGARLTELCVLLHRVEATDRQYTRVRTQQVEKWLAELDRQFKIASRLIEVARQDLALIGGQP
jgi:hypothetical protein